MLFWIELFLIFHMAVLLVDRLKLHLCSGERNALAVFSGVGIKSVLLFVFLLLDLSTFISFPGILTVVVYLLYFTWTKVRPMELDEQPVAQVDGKELSEVSGLWILIVLFMLSQTNAWFFPVTGADGVWHHVKGMVYGLPRVDFESDQIIAQFRQYPPLIGLLYGWLISADIESVTIVFPILYLCLLTVVYCRVREHVENSAVAGMATLLVGTTPYLWWHSFLPFLDWTAGVFYAVGVLYWFSLIKNISESTGDKDASQNKSLAILSGFLFGLASWTRPEFVIYSAVPLFLLVCVCDQKRETFYGRNTVIGRFAISALVLPTAWFLVLLNFDGPLDGTFKQLILVCAGLWIGVGLALSGAVKLTPRVFTAVCVVAIATGLVALFIILPEDISPWTVLTVRLFRLFAVHVFFAGTVFLGVFLFSERLRQLSLAEKTLGALLLLFLLTQFFIYAYAGLKWPTLTDFVYNTFIHPGNSINLSDTRGTIAFYPAFVFFIFCIPRIRFDIESASVRRIVLAIVAVNLTILILVFAGPRIKFVAENWDKSYEQLAETSGPPDLPNQFVKTYQVAHQLKDKGSRIKSLFLPPGNREGSIRSVMTQVLFGANLTFEDDPDYWTNLKNAGSSAYVVSRSEGKDKICHGRKGEVLGDTGFVVCRLGKSQVKSLEPLSDF